MRNPNSRAHHRPPCLPTFADEAVSERVVKKTRIGADASVGTTHVVAKLMGKHGEEGSPQHAEPIALDRLDVIHSFSHTSDKVL